MLGFLISTLVLGAAANDAVSTRQGHPDKIPPLMGLREIHYPSFSSEDGLRHTQNFSLKAENGVNIHLHYNIEHDETSTVINLDSLFGIRNGSTKHNHDEHSTETVRIVFESTDQVDAFVRGLRLEKNHTYITGGHHWGSIHPTTSEARPIIHRVASEVSSGTEVNLIVVKVGMWEFTKNAEVWFSTNHLSHNMTMDDDDVHAEPLKDSMHHHHVKTQGIFSWLGNWAGSFITSCWNYIMNYGATIYNLLKKLPAALKTLAVFLVTGEMNCDSNLFHKCWGYNFDCSKKEVKTNVRSLDTLGIVKCYDCFFTNELTVNFKLKIKDYNLQLASLTGEGESRFNIDLRSTLSGKQLSNQILLYKNILPSFFSNIVFNVGPIHLAFDMEAPVYAGYRGNSEGTATLQAAAGAIGKFKYGVSYDGKYNLINDFSLTPSHSYNYRNNMNLAMEVYVNPTVRLRVQNFLRADVSLRPSVQVTLSKTSGSCPSDYSDFSLNLGYSGYVGYDLTYDSKQPSQCSWGSWLVGCTNKRKMKAQEPTKQTGQIWKKELYSACFKSSGSGHLLSHEDSEDTNVYYDNNENKSKQVAVQASTGPAIASNDTSLLGRSFHGVLWKEKECPQYAHMPQYRNVTIQLYNIESLNDENPCDFYLNAIGSITDSTDDFGGDANPVSCTAVFNFDIVAVDNGQGSCNIFFKEDTKAPVTSCSSSDENDCSCGEFPPKISGTADNGFESLSIGDKSGCFKGIVKGKVN
mmetsp:Transcript_24531/g.39360  ORF Transcript_24531/g.39360 Transcript_24531/m.39360 type:complete len:748 (-) Transcript_24531:259-2502(-)